MTTRERILVLADSGDYLQLIAARLGLSLEQVERTLADPTYEPPEITSGSSTQYAMASVSGGGDLTFVSSMVVPLVQIEREEDSLTNPSASFTNIQQVGAGGVVAEPEILGPPEDPEWKVEVFLSAVNLSDPTVFAKGVYETPLHKKRWTVVKGEDVSQNEGWAEDLTINTFEAEEFGEPIEGFQIKSTAGGLFYVEMLCQFSLAE